MGSSFSCNIHIVLYLYRLSPCSVIFSISVTFSRKGPDLSTTKIKVILQNVYFKLVELNNSQQQDTAKLDNTDKGIRVCFGWTKNFIYSINLWHFFNEIYYSPVILCLSIKALLIRDGPIGFQPYIRPRLDIFFGIERPYVFFLVNQYCCLLWCIKGQ